LRPERISISEELLEASGQLERVRVQQRELLLDPDRHLGRCLEGFARGVEIDLHATD
jgi:hypothetical protein